MIASLIYTFLYLYAGVMTVRFLLPRHRPLNRLWLGLSLGLLELSYHLLCLLELNLFLSKSCLCIGKVFFCRCKLKLKGLKLRLHICCHFFCSTDCGHCFYSAYNLVNLFAYKTCLLESVENCICAVILSSIEAVEG